MKRNRSLLIALTVFGALTCAVLQCSAKGAVPMDAYTVSTNQNESPNVPKMLFAEIVSQPDHLVLAADGSPDFSGILFTIAALNQNNKEYVIVSEATLDTVKKHLQVEMSTEPMDPDGLLCTLTFSAPQNQQAVSDTLKIPFAAAPQSTTTVTTTTPRLSTSTTHANTSQSTVPTTVTTALSAQSTTSVSSKSTSSAAPNSAPYLLGDCNADGKLSTADMVLLTKYLVCTEKELPCKQAADLDGSSILNAIDLTWMKRLLLGQLNHFPVKNPLVIDSFTPSTTSLSDVFSDWHFHVIIKHQYSVPERVWTVDDFKGIENIKVVSMYDQQEPYRQIVDIALMEPSKESVLQMIHSIESLNLKEIKEIQVLKDAFGG